MSGYWWPRHWFTPTLTHRESLLLQQEQGDKRGIAESLEALARLFMHEGAPERGVLLSIDEAIARALG